MRAHGNHLADQREINMKKLILTTATLALGAFTAHAEEVRVYNWSDYIDEALLEKFEQETGLIGKSTCLNSVT